MEPSFFSQFIARITSETPMFFKKIVLFGISLGAIGLSLKGIDLAGVKLPFDLNTICGYFIAIGTVCTIIAKSATTDPNLQAQGGSNVVVNQNEKPPVSTSEPISPPIPTA
jgi:hypothetical protein